MSAFINIIARGWHYIINHHWSKDLLRANLLLIFLVVLYQFLHFHWQPIHLGLFLKGWLLMNICLIFKMLLDGIDRYQQLKKDSNAH